MPTQIRNNYLNDQIKRFAPEHGSQAKAAEYLIRLGLEIVNARTSLSPKNKNYASSREVEIDRPSPSAKGGRLSQIISESVQSKRNDCNRSTLISKGNSISQR